MDKEFYTAEEVAELLRVTPLTVYRMIKDGRLKAHRIGRSLRITRENIDQWKASSMVGKDNVVTVDFSNHTKDDSSA